MPLTPQDVQNKLFGKAFRGYDMEEVDGFLDEVEAELVRLMRQHNDQQTQGGQSAPSLEKQPAAAPATGLATSDASAPPAVGASAPPASDASAPPAADTSAPPAALADSDETEVQQAALRVLGMAEQTLSGARLEAAEQLGSARTQAAALLEAARVEADELLSSARTEADGISAQARDAHERADADLAVKLADATAGLEARRAALETHIEELRAFEREYRSRLKAYLAQQLGDLEGRVVPEDAGQGVPARGRSADQTGAPASSPELDLSDDAPDMATDADQDVPLGQHEPAQAPKAAPPST